MSKHGSVTKRKRRPKLDKRGLHRTDDGSFPAEYADTAEKRLLREFEDAHWELPLLNSTRGYERGEDRHYCD